jgi:hypothetical protein
MDKEISPVVTLASEIVNEITLNPNSLPSCVSTGIDKLSTLLRLLKNDSYDRKIVLQLSFMLTDLQTRMIKTQEDLDSWELSSIRSRILSNVHTPNDDKNKPRFIRCFNALRVQYDNVPIHRYSAKLYEEINKSTNWEALEYIDEFLIKELKN